VTSRSEEQKLMRQWWVLIVLALAFLGLSYGFFYLATDSGSIWQYAACIIFLLWAVKYIVRGVRMAIAR